jgi:hypothetical protein
LETCGTVFSTSPGFEIDCGFILPAVAAELILPACNFIAISSSRR